MEQLLNYDKVFLLKKLPNIGNTKINKEYVHLLNQFSTFEDFINHDICMKFDKVDIRNAIEDVKKLHEIIDIDKSVKVVTVLDNEYPEELERLGNSKPVAIFTKGNVDLLKSSKIGIIGTRKPGEQTIHAARGIIEMLVNTDKSVIVSGLALGCDSLAHSISSELGRENIAVLPCGFDAILPKRNTQLAETLLNNNGLLITEYEPDVTATRFTPVQRDYIVAALVDKLLALECGIESGTMQTIKKAHELKKIIGAFYPVGDITGDFSGNKMIIEVYDGKKITTRSDLKDFLSKESITVLHEKQLSLF